MGTSYPSKTLSLYISPRSNRQMLIPYRLIQGLRRHRRNQYQLHTHRQADPRWPSERCEQKRWPVHPGSSCCCCSPAKYSLTVQVACFRSAYINNFTDGSKQVSIDMLLVRPALWCACGSWRPNRLTVYWYFCRACGRTKGRSRFMILSKRSSAK